MQTLNYACMQIGKDKNVKQIDKNMNKIW